MNGSNGVVGSNNHASPSFCLTSPNNAVSNLNNPSAASQGSNANLGGSVSSSGSSSAALNNNHNHNNNNHAGLSGGPPSLGVGGGVCGGGGGYSSEGESDEEW